MRKHERYLAIGGAVCLAGCLVLFGAWSGQMWSLRNGIEGSAEASCTDPAKDCAQKDLPAQVRAATAAEAMADLGVWQVFLGTLGLAIGGATLMAAASAAHWAKDAAGHTSRAADIAQNALIADTRAWLAIKGAYLSHPYVRRVGEEEIMSTTLTVRVHNYGRGPALDCVVWAGWRRAGQEVDWIETADPKHVRRVTFDAMMPGEGNETITLHLNDTLTDIYQDGYFILCVLVEYRIVGGADERSFTRQNISFGLPIEGDLVPFSLDEFREMRPYLVPAVDHTSMV